MNNKISNLSAELINKLYGWIPHDLNYEKIVFFPDACPGKSPLPTGTAVLTNQENWRKFAISDIGCGMLMAKSQLKLNDFNKKEWNEIYKLLKKNKSDKPQLGSGNHFLDMFCSLKDERIYFVVHTGSRHEGRKVEKLLDKPAAFDKEYENTVKWARENRMSVYDFLEKVYGKLDLVLDKPHNTYEILNNGNVIIRKGSVKLEAGDRTIIPSNMEGDMILVEATKEISKYLNSMSHGTGRVMSRGESKQYAEQYDYEALRKLIYIPEQISNASIKTEAPFCYRNIDDCMNLLNGVVTEVERFIPIAYIGQL